MLVSYDSCKTYCFQLSLLIFPICSFKEAKYEMDICDYDNRTALHIAVSDNQEHIVDFLLGECNLQNVARDVKDRYFI